MGNLLPRPVNPTNRDHLGDTKPQNNPTYQLQPADTLSDVQAPNGSSTALHVTRPPAGNQAPEDGQISWS